MYLPLCKVADTPFHIQGDEIERLKTAIDAIGMVRAISLPLPSLQLCDRDKCGESGADRQWTWSQSVALCLIGSVQCPPVSPESVVREEDTP